MARGRPHRDSVEWLEMMRDHSQLTDCKPMFAQCAAEMRGLREIKELSMEALNNIKQLLNDIPKPLGSAEDLKL